MSHPSASVSVPQTPATASSSNIERIFDAALKSYQKKTKKDLKSHDLFKQLEKCDSPAAILTKFQAVQFDDPSQTGSDDRLKRWLVPTLNVLCAFSNTLGEGVSLAFPPAKAVFAGVGVLLLAAKDVAESQDILIDIFGRIESFFVRLEIYTGVPLTPEMTDKMVQITVEILDILATATKEVKRSTAKKFLKRVIGRTDLEDGMKKLDKLTNEEVAMASAQLLKVAHNIDNNVMEVNEGVRRVDENVLIVKSEVQLVNDNIKAVDDKVQTMADDGMATAKDVKIILQQAIDGVDNVKRNKLRESLRRWQSPPDPSTNHHIVGGRQHAGTAEWFIESDNRHIWKVSGSLMWIHGKAGSGKSVLCSAIINDVSTLCKAGLASMAYFYFDFRDVDKQSRRNLLQSLLVQLSTCSDAFCDVLFRLYEAHDNGARQPSDSDLMQCLKEMLTLPDQGPIYLIMDALDECPDTSGVPSAREQVLDFVKELVSLHRPGLRLCITSRPEVDICDALESLTSQTVSLQDELGQKKDISDYVRSVVCSGSGKFMKRWRQEDKEDVIETLSERADGMFRWVFCQLEVLRNCLPQNVRRVLRELPASLDETYQRMLREIMNVNPDQVYRLLQCLTVSTRPLRVDELAEVLALDFDVADDGIPVLNKGWRWDDKEQGVLSTCSSLIVVVDDYDNDLKEETRVVQFAHFSVKEFLTSDRLADIKSDISRFHIRLEPAHTIIAQSCLAILLQSDHDDTANSTSALSKYAAQHWVGHAHFGNVSLRVEDGMRRLFDPAKQYFTAWLNIHNLDFEWRSFQSDRSSLLERFRQRSKRSKFTSLGEGDAPLCLYYAALCGFRDLTRYLIIKYPQHVDATVGRNKSPLAAALRNRHIQVAELLHQHGADLPIGYNGRTLLHAASADGLVNVAQWLLKIGADANAQGDSHRTPLYFATVNGRLDIVRMLLGHGVDVNAVAATDNDTSLHVASFGGQVDVVGLLIEHGADVHARGRHQSTPLCLASTKMGNVETVQLLIKHGADIHARDQRQSTPLHLASSGGSGVLLSECKADMHRRGRRWSTPLYHTLSQGNTEIVQLLIKHGADVHARDQSQLTPLHLALDWRNSEIARLLIEHGADVHARDQSQSTPLHIASSGGGTGAVRLLIEHGADVHARDQSQSTPLHLASSSLYSETATLLIEHGADVHARDQSQSTPLHLALAEGNSYTARLLIEHGADVHARDQRQSTPLHLAFSGEDSKNARLLIEHGADVHARDQHQSTPLHLALSWRDSGIARLLIEHGADVHARDQSQSTPLHFASYQGISEIARLLIEHGADVHARDQHQSTPLHEALFQGRSGIPQLLIKHGADVHARDQRQLTPLHQASTVKDAEAMRLLIKHGADVHAWDQDQSTPLHMASSSPSGASLRHAARVLIEHGASVNAYNKNHQTPLHCLSSCRDPDTNGLRLLLENGADVDVEDDKGLTPFQIASAEGESKQHREIAQLLLDHRNSIVSNTL